MISNTITGLRLVVLVPLFALLAQPDAPARDWFALAIFLFAGATDVLDGYLARRLGETSAFGAMLDLVADRLLTLATVTGLIAGGRLGALVMAAGLILIVRDVVVAALGEALPGRLGIRAGLMEKIKIACQFAGLALLIVPPDVLSWRFAGLNPGGLLLLAAAALACLTLADYSMRAAREFKASPLAPLSGGEDIDLRSDSARGRSRW